VRRGGELVGVAPLTTLRGYRGTRLLKPELRRWFDPAMGWMARVSMCFVETNLAGYLDRDPFFAVHEADREAVRSAIIAHLFARRDIDGVIVSWPMDQRACTAEESRTAYLTLPLVRIDLMGSRTMDEYLERIPRKRRKNLRADEKAFSDAGATIEVHDAPLPSHLLEEVYGCLRSSQERNRDRLEVPYGDLLNSLDAFREQPQTTIIARAGGGIAGFFSFVRHGRSIYQCHGGFDYERSLEVKAYPNLMHAAVRYALDNGIERICLGPLNNEAKRRVGDLLPMVTTVRYRNRMAQRYVARFFPMLEVYRGPVTPAGGP
jgi:predicted N-acyltransferase